ncbi:MAG: hypothetical protein D6798_11425 [Deltaproteobacteria bacterium]|nr:MAG: hypothetical protein D6798_11425 [Deltaproteobacteria bacterium]
MTAAGVGADAQADPICPIEACEPDTSLPCNDICVPVTVGFKTRMVCNVDVTDGTDGDATAYAVANAASVSLTPCDSYEYCAFGNDNSGKAFFCGWDDYDSTLVGVDLLGGDGDDYLSFVCEDGVNPPEDVYMQEWPGYSMTGTFIGRINGGDGDDTIIGSRRDSVDYQDSLNGGNGADKMAGLQGNDAMDGGGHADQMCGGEGDDGMPGGGGADTMCGENGEDHIVAGFADDVLVGGNNADWLDGGPGTDECDVTADDDPYSCDATTTRTCGTGGVIECPI